MAAKSNKLSKSEIDDLKSVGYDPDTMTPAQFPENLSPVLRAKALAAWQEKQDGGVTATDLPTAVDRQNELARERAAANGDEAMQKVTGVKPDDAVDTKSNRQQSVNGK